MISKLLGKSVPPSKLVMPTVVRSKLDTVPAPKNSIFKLPEIMLEKSTKDIIELILDDVSNKAIKETTGTSKMKNDNIKMTETTMTLKIAFNLLNKLNIRLSLLKSINLFISRKNGNISKKTLKLEPVIVNKIIAKQVLIINIFS